MKTPLNKITLNLAGDAEVSVKGFIAPFEYTQSNFHETWDELVNIRAAEPEKQYPASVFQAFLPSEPVAVGDCWQIQEEAALTLLLGNSLPIHNWSCILIQEIRNVLCGHASGLTKPNAPRFCSVSTGNSS